MEQILEFPFKVICYFKGHDWRGMFCWRCLEINWTEYHRQTNELWAQVAAVLRKPIMELVDLKTIITALNNSPQRNSGSDGRLL
jgi:hypothetical protein